MNIASIKFIEKIKINISEMMNTTIKNIGAGESINSSSSLFLNRNIGKTIPNKHIITKNHSLKIPYIAYLWNKSTRYGGITSIHFSKSSTKSFNALSHNSCMFSIT